MPDDPVNRSPAAMAMKLFWRQPSARWGVAILTVFALFGTYAPFLSGDIALLWWDETGLSFPGISALFNKTVFRDAHDYFFNLLALTTPLFLGTALVAKKRLRPGRVIKWGLLGTVGLFALTLLPLFPGPEGFDSLWTKRGLPAADYTRYVRQAELEKGDLATTATRNDRLLDADGQTWTVLFRTSRPYDATGQAVDNGDPNAVVDETGKALTRTYLRVTADGGATTVLKDPGDLHAPKLVTALFPIVPHRFYETYDGMVLALPGAVNPSTERRFLLGADGSGRDIFARMCYGARISLTIGIVATVISMTIGIVVGAIAGYFGGWVDIVIMRLVEIMMCFPSFLLVLIVVAMVGRELMVIIVVFGLTGWAGTARLVRGEFLSLAQREYVLAARTLGFNRPRIMFRHVLPNSLTPLLISAAFSIAGAVLAESGLSFLGLVEARTPSWGLILSEGRTYPEYVHIIYVPGLAIFALVTSLNLIGNALREAMDPRSASQ